MTVHDHYLLQSARTVNMDRIVLSSVDTANICHVILKLGTVFTGVRQAGRERDVTKVRRDCL